MKPGRFVLVLIALSSSPQVFSLASMRANPPSGEVTNLPSGGVTNSQAQDQPPPSPTKKRQVVDSAIDNTIRNAVVTVIKIVDETSALATVNYSKEEEETFQERKTVPDYTQGKNNVLPRQPPTKHVMVQSTRKVQRAVHVDALVVGIPKSIGEGEKFKTTLYRAGRYTAGSKVLARFATSVQLANELLAQNQ